MEKLFYDLHMHSCLSPCGDELMTPGNIVGMSVINELDVIALTDHNTCKNCPAFLDIATKYGILAIPGMELTTSEEVHVLCLFPTLNDALSFDKYVYEQLPRFHNKPEIFGNQIICNEKDEPIEEEPLLLINATTISYDDVFDLVSSYSGIAIPAHIDKSSNSVLANLGSISKKDNFSTYEVTSDKKRESVLSSFSDLKGLNHIINSDAHYLENIKLKSEFIYAKEKTPEAVIDSLKNVINSQM